MVKKQLIMEKALELFAKNGFEATSIQQITEGCGISKGAFYLSFTSKDELIYAITDQFMSELIADIEQSVNSNEAVEDLLYNYYFISFNAFQKHANFAKILMKEQFTAFNTELLKKMEMYNSILDKAALSIVERQYSQTNPGMHADLVFVIQGFLRHYGSLFLVDDLPIDIEVLCHALVEKTSILAQYSTIPLISPEFFKFSKCDHVSTSKEQVIDMLTKKINETDVDVIRESLELLQKDLLEPTLSTAIIQGLLKNLRDHSHCKWTAYLYEHYVKTKSTN